MRYVTADIHGCYSQFIELLELIKFSDEDTLYIIGDIIDRGPQPGKMLKYVISHKNIIMLKGNHEDMMLKCFLGNDKRNNIIWAYNGGEVTYKQFKRFSKKLQDEILEYLQNLPNYLIIDNKILVHAGIYAPKIQQHKTIEENMKEQYEDDLLWIRSDFLYSPTNIKDYTVIFGHTPTDHMQFNDTDTQSLDAVYEEPKMKIWHDPVYKDKIGIDCGCVFGGQLACICLDTMEEFYVK